MIPSSIPASTVASSESSGAQVSQGDWLSVGSIGFSKALAEALMRQVRPTSEPVEVSLPTILSIPAVWRSLDILTSLAECVDMRLYRKTGSRPREVEVDHPNAWLTKLTSRHMHAGKWRAAMLFQALTSRCGGFSELKRGEDGFTVTQVIPLDSRRMGWGVVSGQFYYLYYDNFASEPRPIKPDNMYHIFGMSANGIMGLDALSLLEDEFGLSLGRRRHAYKFAISGGGLSGFFMLPASQSIDFYKNFFQTVQSQIKDLSENFKVAPLFDGVKYERLQTDGTNSFTQMEMDPDRIGTIFGIPGFMLGSKTKSMFENWEDQMEIMQMFTVNPWLRRHELEHNLKFLTLEEFLNEEVYYEYNREQILQGAPSRVHKMLTEDLKASLLSWQEARGKLNLPTETNDTFFVESNNITLVNGDAINRGVLPEAESPDDTAETDDTADTTEDSNETD